MNNTQQPQASRQVGLSRGCDNSDYDFYIHSDGSGHLDHLGGFGAVVSSVRYSPLAYEPVAGCCTQTETGRAEFLAILSALHAIVDVMQWDKTSQLQSLMMSRPAVKIFSDREDLVGSINKVYSRKRNGDLWQQFAWYERIFQIDAQHVKRATDATHDIADTVASEMRLVLWDYMQTQQDSKII